MWVAGSSQDAGGVKPPLRMAASIGRDKPAPTITRCNTSCGRVYPARLAYILNILPAP